MTISKAALEIAVNGTKDERRYLTTRNFGLFFVYYFTDYIKYPFAPFHYEMMTDIKDLMEEKYREVMWLAFRESAKTSLAKGFRTWLS